MTIAASDKTICELVVEAAADRRLKVARIAFDVSKRLEALHQGADTQQFDRCVTYLAEQGVIAAYGDTKRWRFSEIALQSEAPLLTPPDGPNPDGPVQDAWQRQWQKRIVSD